MTDSERGGSSLDGSVTKDGSEAKESETEQQSKPKTPVLRKVNLTLRHGIIFYLISKRIRLILSGGRKDPTWDSEEGPAKVQLQDVVRPVQSGLLTRQTT